MIFFALYIVTCVLGIVLSVQKLISGEIKNILFPLVPILMLLIGILSLFKKGKGSDIIDKYLIPIFLIAFGSFLISQLFVYIKKGAILISIITIFFTIITFKILREYIDFHYAKPDETLNIAKLKGKGYTIQMQLPDGWQTHSRLKNEFFEFENKKINWGRIEEFLMELKEQTFSEYIENEVKMYLDEIYGKDAKKNEYKQIIYKGIKQICGKETVEIILDLEEAVEYHTYIRQDPVYLFVLFKVDKHIYPSYEANIRTALESIKIQ